MESNNSRSISIEKGKNTNKKKDSLLLQLKFKKCMQYLCNNINFIYYAMLCNIIYIQYYLYAILFNNHNKRNILDVI